MKRLLVILFAALAFYAALALGAHNARAAFQSPELEAMLPTPVPVFCTDNINGPAYALINRGEIYLDSTDCQSLLHEQPSTNGHGGYSWAQHAHTLYHEWWHVAFHERNEQLTECGAYAIYRYMLVTRWGLAATTAQRFYDATLFSSYAPLPCSPDAVDPVGT